MTHAPYPATPSDDGPRSPAAGSCVPPSVTSPAAGPPATPSAINRKNPPHTLAANPYAR